jgi:hypothetical protein
MSATKRLTIIALMGRWAEQQWVFDRGCEKHPVATPAKGRTVELGDGRCQNLAYAVVKRWIHCSRWLKSGLL